MYNQYLNGDDFILLDPEPQEAAHTHQERRQPPPRPHQPPTPQKPKSDLVGEVAGGLSHLLEGVLKHFSLEKFDTGDILLVLIILFLYLEEEDNLELVITLGLLLLLGLGDDKGKAD